MSDCPVTLMPRPQDSHKGTFGHGLLVAGSYGMAGAAALSGKAALRSGLGKLTIHTPRLNVPPIQIMLPEAVLSIDPDDKYFSMAPLHQNGYEAIAIGPGLGQDKKTAAALLSFITTINRPLVLDADALNILAKENDWPCLLPKGTILTPHPKEWQRLLGYKANNNELQEEALLFAQKHGLYIILKGHRTAIYTPDGKTFINDTGNSGMATAGSGDVLTGILLSLLTEGYEPLQACRLGVWLHGRAGDLAANKLGEHSLIASDIIENLGPAFLEINTLTEK